jgi:hypothetical protein
MSKRFTASEKWDKPWHRRLPPRLSQRQTDALLKAGFDPARMSLQDALAEHWELIRASDKQRAILTRYYPAEQVNKLPRWDAAKLLDGLAKNGWRKP